MPVHEIVHVIAMRHGLMPASGAVTMLRLVSPAVVMRRALVRIRPRDFESVLIHMVAMRMMQMTVMQIIDVIIVLDCGMPTVGAVFMLMIGMMSLIAGSHLGAPCLKGESGKDVPCRTSERLRRM